ncbi:MAG: hypothetical protein QM784_17345 [Polyangiaceae bacterium]
MEDKSDRIPSSVAPDWIALIARDEGPVLHSGFRVVVIEGDGRHAMTDFQVLEEALRYADDVASESEIPPPIAYVFAPGLQYVRRGRHYAEP